MTGKLRGFLLGTTMLGLCMPAVAQDETGDDLKIDIITVTAQKREESIQDVGLAVSAFDAEAINSLNARDIRDLSAVVPNFIINEVNTGPGLTQVSLRGVNSQDPEKSFDPAVGVFIDGVYLGTSAFNLLNTFDLERVEVLRGPQGTLFGRNTTGGAINVFRTKPTGEFGATAAITVGNDGRNDYEGVLNAPIVEDLLALKVSGYSENDDGLWDNPTGGPTGAKSRWSASGRLLFTPTPNFEFDVIYDHAEDHSELTSYIPQGVATASPLPILITETNFPVSPATVIAAHGPDALCVLGNRCIQTDNSFTTINDAHEMDAELDAVTVNATYDVDDSHEITGIFGWRNSSEAVYLDFDGTDLTAFNVVRNQEYEQFTGEIRLASQYDGPFNFVAGAFYFHSEYSLRQAIKLDLALVGAPVPFGALFINGNGDEDDHQSTTYAVFAQGDYDLTSNLTFTGGLRASWDEKEIFTQFFGSNFGPTDPYQVTDGVPTGRPLTGSGSASENWFVLTGKGALNWQVTDDVLLYVSFSRGYNVGGFSARAGTPEDVTTPFDPEFINAYEAGVKSTLADGRVVVNAAVFYNDYRDKLEESIQAGPPPSFTSTTVRNVAGARIAGFELETTALLTRDLSLQASLGFLDAEYTDHPGFVSSSQFVSDPAQPAGTLLAADFSTLTLRRTPEITASVTPTFSREIGPGALTVTSTVRYIDEQYSEFFNDQRGLLPEQFLLDAAISYEFGGPDSDRYQIKVFGENLLDEQDGNGFVNAVVDFQAVSRPLQWGVELRAKL